MAPPSQPSDAAMQTRIINHMNADHADSLALFLQHHNKLSPTMASSPQLDSFTLSHMTIKSSYGRSLIELDPPLKSYAEARERMVSMHREALQGLGLSDVVVTEYVPPSSVLDVCVFVLCLICYVSFSPLGRADLGPDAAQSRVNLLFTFWSLGGLWPGLSYFAYDQATRVFILMIAIHVGEVSYLIYSRLGKHRVKIGSLVWWQWIASCFIEGAGSFRRFDRLVKEKEMEKEKKKH